MCFFFVNCHCLEHAVTSRGLAGRWIGNTQYKEFRCGQRRELMLVCRRFGRAWCWRKPRRAIVGAPRVGSRDDAMPEVGRKIQLD